MITLNKIIKFRNVLLYSEKFELSDALLLIRDNNSECTVLDPDDVENDIDEEPKFAAENNMKYALSMQDLQGIVDNAYHQNPNCKENDLLQAFLFYYDHDAFITFDIT